MGLRQEMERLKRENLALRDRLSKFTDVWKRMRRLTLDFVNDVDNLGL